MVTDEGQPQTIVSFAHGDEPVNLLLLFDISESMQQVYRADRPKRARSVGPFAPGRSRGHHGVRADHGRASGFQRQSGRDRAADLERGEGLGRRRHHQHQLRHRGCGALHGKARQPERAARDSDPDRQSRHQFSAHRWPGDPRTGQSGHGLKCDRDRPRHPAKSTGSGNVSESGGQGRDARQCVPPGGRNRRRVGQGRPAPARPSAR